MLLLRKGIQKKAASEEVSMKEKLIEFIHNLTNEECAFIVLAIAEERNKKVGRFVTWCD